MTAEVTLLDPTETDVVLASHRFGKTESILSKIAENLMSVLDTDSSVFVTGMTESTINSLRTRMYRHDVGITVRKVERNGQRGHVILARRALMEGEDQR